MSVDELNKICHESGAKLKKKMIVAICNYEKDIYDMSTDDWINILKGFKMQMVYISEVRREMTKIYEHEISVGKTVYNPFLDPELSAENISAQINQFIYVSQKQLDNSIGNLNDDLIGGCIAQLIYEGAKTYTDIIELDMSDIDFENSKINFKKYSITASPKLINYVRQYDENNVYVAKHYKNESGNRSFKLSRVRENSFAKIIVYYDKSGKSISSDITKTFQNSCSQIFMKLGYSSSQIYNSGALNYIFRRCDYSFDELTSLFKSNSRPRSMMSPVEKLDEYAKEYGLDGKNARYYLKDYYNSFMLQNAPFE